VRGRFVTSEHNPDIKRIKALRDRRSVRHEERLCIVEGPRFVEDAARLVVPRLLVLAEGREANETPPADDVLIVPDSLFAAISDTTTPQGMLAVFPFPEVQTPSGPELLLVADAVQDPGNLGAMIRSAAALGATGVICAPGTVDPYSPKVIRSSAAAQWLVPIHMPDAMPTLLAPTDLLIADGEAPKPIDLVDLRRPIAIAVGSEGHGVGNMLRSMPHTLIAIPMTGQVESLNAGIAASIFLYEAQRQRRAATAC
jgi:RNA methyltransferase, TrmH family